MTMHVLLLCLPADPRHYKLDLPGLKMHTPSKCKKYLPLA